MIIERFFPDRWARIAAWTAAAIAWATSLLVVQAGRPVSAETAPTGVPTTEAPTTSTTLAPIPNPAPDGVVVLRFTPTPPPPPQVITRTVTVPGVSRGGGVATPAPRAPVVSSGS